MEKTLTELQFEIGLGKPLEEFTEIEKEVLRQFIELERGLY